jgi:branched-chain amino acid transport system substrate-binding protein
VEIKYQSIYWVSPNERKKSNREKEDNKMKKIYLVSLMVVLIGAMLLTASSPSTSAAPAAIKIGVLIPYSGSASKEAKTIERGVDFALQEIGGNIKGIPIVLQKEDETDDPTQCVAKVKKLVEQDKVAAILGPIGGQNEPAVVAYMKDLGVPLIVGGEAESNIAEKKVGFFPAGTIQGAVSTTGIFAYEELGARKAAVIYQAFQYGTDIRDNFKASFTAKGGTIVSEQSVPFGTMDMAPFLTKMQTVDVIVLLLVAPSDVSFVKQYRDFGIKVPVIFGESWPQGEAAYLNKQVGDAIIGMYGQQSWSALVDTSDNKKLVDTLKAQNNGILPGITTVRVGYMKTNFLIQGMQSIKGDITRESITKALDALKSYKSPTGDIIMKDRVGYPDIYIVKATRVDANNISWQPVKKYPNQQK